eukprot:TRINITY_DN1264_c3_g1_i1.p1 TRINITY_DN1264_c3_g1~~TRINITY_DN1264_c3_g1_i1.p1  ORF type:complete len:448 (-),score=121.42 TRINITY_DN1264_c3_g1_i1:263-1606(-)
MTDTVYAACLYCSKATRKWTLDPKEDHIEFILCDPKMGIPIKYHKKSKPNILDTTEIRPLPYVKGTILNTAKMTNYPWNQIKDFVYMIDWKSEFPSNGEWGDEPSMPTRVPPSKPVPVVPSKSDDSKVVEKTPSKSSSGDKSKSSSSSNRKAKTNATQKKKRIEHQSEMDNSSIQSIILGDSHSQNLQAASAMKKMDPELEALVLSPVAIKFLNEPDLQEDDDVQTESSAQKNVNGGVVLNPKEVSDLDSLTNIFDKLQSLVDNIGDQHHNQQQQQGQVESDIENTSIFSALGVAAYFGVKSEFEDKMFLPEIKKPMNRSTTTTAVPPSTLPPSLPSGGLPPPNALPPPLPGSNPRMSMPPSALPPALPVSNPRMSMPPTHQPPVPSPRNHERTGSVPPPRQAPAPPGSRPPVSAPPTAPSRGVPPSVPPRGLPPPVMGRPPTSQHN